MTELEKEMLKQKIYWYQYIVENCLINYQNVNNFNKIKEELFQDLLKVFKSLI